MIVSSCPRCNEELRVPFGEFPEDAYAQCPWCRETFPLSDVLTSLPPMLEILSADGHPIVAVQPVAATGPGGGVSDLGMPAIATGQPTRNESIDRDAGRFDFDNPAAAETVVGASFSESLEFDQAAEEDLDAAVRSETVKEEAIRGDTLNEEPSVGPVDDAAFPGIQDAADTWDGEQVAAPVASMKVSPRRSKQKNGSGIKTAIMIVLGGLAAFPIAGGILLAVGRAPDLGFWPFDGSSNSTRRSVAASPADLSARPSLQPNKPAGRSLDSGLSGDTLSMPGDPADSALEQIMDPSAGQETVAGSEVTDADTVRLAAPDDPFPAQGTADASISSGAATMRGGDSADMLELPSDPEAVAEITSLESPLEMPTDTDEEHVAASKSDASADAPKPPAAVPSEEESASDAAAESIATAERAIEALLSFEGSDEQRNRQLAKTYAQIAAACDVAAGNTDALRQLARRIGNSSILADIGYAGSQWLVYRGRKSDGIALIGQPGTSAEGQTLTLTSGKVVPLLGGQPLPSSERVLAMGRIVDEGSSVELLLAEPLP